jgi:hypothetical protein
MQFFHPGNGNEASNDRNRNMNAQPEKVDDLCRDFNIYLWNGCATFIFNNKERRPKAPKYLFIFVKTQNCQKYSGENLRLC